MIYATPNTGTVKSIAYDASGSAGKKKKDEEKSLKEQIGHTAPTLSFKEQIGHTAPTLTLEETLAKSLVPATAPATTNKTSGSSGGASSPAVTAQLPDKPDYLSALIEEYNNNPSGPQADLGALLDRYAQSADYYKAKTDEEIQAQAEADYKSYYDQARLSAQQATDKTNLALRQQREGLGSSYDRQIEESGKQYDLNRSAADRQSLSRGMQRSSYNAMTLANIDQQRAKAAQNIMEQRTAAEANLDEQIANNETQLAEKLAGYDLAQASDIQKRVNELKDTEYERAREASQYQNQLASDIYEKQYAAQRDSVADEQYRDQLAADLYAKQYGEYRDTVGDTQWQASFDASQKKSSGGGSSKKSSTTTPAISDTVASVAAQTQKAVELNAAMAKGREQALAEMLANGQTTGTATTTSTKPTDASLLSMLNTGTSLPSLGAPATTTAKAPTENAKKKVANLNTTKATKK